MIVMTMLLLAAAPLAPAAHPARIGQGRVVRARRKPHRAIPMSLHRFRADECAGTACETAQADSRYRLPLPSAPEPTSKDRAMAEDGTRCALIGQTICQHPARKIVQVGDSGPVAPQ